MSRAGEPASNGYNPHVRARSVLSGGAIALAALVLVGCSNGSPTTAPPATSSPPPVTAGSPADAALAALCQDLSRLTATVARIATGGVAPSEGIQEVQS